MKIDYVYKGEYIIRLIIILSFIFIINTVYAVIEHESIIMIWILTVMLLGLIFLCGKIGELIRNVDRRK